MKKHCAILLFFVLLGASCSSNHKAEYVIGVSQCSNDLWRETVNREIMREASFYPEITVEIKTVRDDTEQQIADIEDFIDRNVDLLVVAPNESTAITPVVQKAYSKGIPVILLDRKIDTEDYSAYVGANNYQLAYELGGYAGTVLGGTGNVVIMRGWKGSTADNDRYNGFNDAIKEYPGISIVAERYGDFLEDAAREEMESLMKENHRIDLVFAMNDPMARGIHTALEYSPKPKPYIIGIDALPGQGGGIDMIARGIIDASFIYPTGGDRVIDVAHRILNGLPYERENILYTAVVDRSNARVIQLQTDQIFEQQNKVDRLNEQLDVSLLRYSNQRQFFFISLLALVVTIISLLLVAGAYRSKSRTNTKLRSQNEEIKGQARVLAEQKEQLEHLSLQLEQATHAKLVFFTNISHEFKTPLSLIMGPVDALLTDKTPDDTDYELLSLIKRNSGRLLNLISQLIEFRAFENDRMTVYFTRGDLGAFLSELNSHFSDALRRKRVAFSFEDGCAGPLELWFDKEKMEKIYFNILSNALKFVNTGGEIRVSLARKQVGDGDFAEIAIFNSGSYIPEDKRRAIFERFFKLGTHEGGAGIGLALTNALIEVHSGSIEIESDADKGTTFRVTIPFDQPEGDCYSESDNFHYKSDYTENQVAMIQIEEIVTDILEDNLESDTPLVLVIEDNPEMRHFVCSIFSDEYAVVEAANGEEGIKKAVKYIPDIIISDVMMPEKDGFEICRILKENVTTSHIPIILLTAFSLDEQKAAGFESGADAYIPKPFNSELLKIRVRRLIENRKKIREAFGSNWIADGRKTSLAEAEQEFINRFRAYVESRISEEELNIDDVARHMGLSRAQFYRKLKSVTDHSPRELILMTKLKYAINCMANQRKTISEAAFESGFSSPSYFAKTFRKFYNESPSDFLKKMVK